MKKNVVIIVLLLVLIALVGYIIWDKTTNNMSTLSNDVESGENVNIENASGENNNEKEKSDNIRTGHEYITKKIIEAEYIDTTNLNDINFIELKPGNGSRTILNVNGKEIEITLEIYGCSALISEEKGECIEFDYRIALCELNNNSTDRHYLTTHRGHKLMYDSGYNSYEIHDATQLNIEGAIKKFNIKLGTLCDAITNEEYIIFYIEGEDTYVDSFYIYNVEGDLLLTAHFNDINSFGNPVPKGDFYENVYPIEFFDSQILYYDMYTSTETGEKVQEDFEQYNKTNDIATNSLRKLTIENGKIVDKIIKTYENVPVGLWN